MRQITLVLFITLSVHLSAQQNIPLYPKEIPNSTSYKMKEIRMDSNGSFFGYRKISEPNVVTVENSIRFYKELVRNKVPAEMHIYPKGNHGFVLSQPADEWMQLLFEWLKKL